MLITLLTFHLPDIKGTVIDFKIKLPHGHPARN